MKKIVGRGVEINAITPSMSATLEFLKSVGNLELPIQFFEAELDCFGKHTWDSKSRIADPRKPETEKRHFEWKYAKGKSAVWSRNLLRGDCTRVCLDPHERTLS